MKPLIILGAGASKDYIHELDRIRDINFMPPLANDLFAARFEDWIVRYPEMLELVGDAARIVPQRMSFESYLVTIREKAKAAKDERLQKQLVALSFYLQRLFWDISLNYRQQARNNYRGLIALIKKVTGSACIVNFNYDILLEYNMPNEITDKIDSFVTGPIKIIKPHGSCDWVYHLKSMFDIEDSYKHLMQEPWYGTQSSYKPELISVRRTDKNTFYKYRYGEGSVAHFYPAIAIPLSSKDEFVAPEAHIRVLQSEIAGTDKVLIIGWKAGDHKLLELLNDYLIKPTSAVIVSGSVKGAEDVAKNLSIVKNLNVSISKNQGFSNFLKSEESDAFFEQ